ncbi:periplasmic heavy metal sensor, partial [Mycobacterium tuberculosis]|nr:periplasmic heavy metal sensor [Mycobacterium tuberculosis]
MILVPDSSDKTGPFGWKWRRGALLLASLALNLFLAGWIVGGVLRPTPRPFDLAGAISERLSPEGRARIAGELRVLDSEIRGLGGRFDAARSRVVAAASGEPFDAEALRMALQSMSNERSGEDARMTLR